jgi:hypothetical protein
MNEDLKALYICLMGLSAKPVKTRKTEQGLAIYLDRVVDVNNKDYTISTKVLPNGQKVTFQANPTCIELKNNE